VAGRRTLTELRPLQDDDLERLAAWLPRTTAELGCQRWASEEALRTAAGKEGVLAVVEGEPVGFVAYEIGSLSPDAARIELLAISPDRRRLGIGSRAVLALERRLARTSKQMYVLVSSELGLAFYFWLRLGYRPLTQREWPASPQAGPAIWLVRALA
jgi:ribosomal protein S18 acetylase RimI-like enzyme